MKVKSESEVPQWCPTLSGPMDCSLPGSSVYGISQARVLEWDAIIKPMPHALEVQSPLDCQGYPRIHIFLDYEVIVGNVSKVVGTPVQIKKD